MSFLLPEDTPEERAQAEECFRAPQQVRRPLVPEKPVAELYQRRLARTDFVAIGYGFLTSVAGAFGIYLLVPWLSVLLFLLHLSPGASSTLLLAVMVFLTHLSNHTVGRVVFGAAWRDDLVGRFDLADHAWHNVRYVIAILLVFPLPFVVTSGSLMVWLGYLLLPVSVWCGARLAERQHTVGQHVVG